MSASSERTHFWQHIPIFTSSGGLVKATFLGHLQPEHAVVQWECLGVLAAVFDGSKSPLDVHQSMRTYKPALDTLCLRCSIGEGRVAHFPSVKAVLAAQAAGQTSQSSELARESWCLSSEGVVLLLSYIASASKRAQFKEQAVATLAVWLGLVGSLDELHDAAEAAIEECIPLCEHGRSEGGGACMHLRPAIAKAMESDQTGPTPQVSLAELLQMLAKQSMSCLSCARFLGFFATTLNLQIIRQWGELGASTEALKLERRPNLAGRRRRHSEVFKKELCSGMLKRLRASSSAAEARVQGVDGRRVREWTHEELHSHLVCAQRVLGQHSGTFAHSEDAARIGKPAVEIKTYNLYVPALGVGIWMCNQALGGGTPTSVRIPMTTAVCDSHHSAPPRSTQFRPIHSAIPGLQPKWWECVFGTHTQTAVGHPGPDPQTKSEAQRDWRGMQHRGEQLTEESAQRWRSRVHDFFTPSEKVAKAPALTASRLANVHDLLGWDHAWQVTCGIGLLAFVAGSPCRALAVDERRFWVSPASLPAPLRARLQGRSRRSCIKQGLAPARLECQWESPRMILHSWLDMGSVGWPAKVGAYSAWALRGSFGFDSCHRRYDNFGNSMASAGLHLLKLENLLVQTFLGGPFHADSNYGKLCDAMSEWVASSDSSDPLFTSMYSAICHDRYAGKLPPDYGTSAHMSAIFLDLPRVVNTEVYGIQTKMNRWFQLTKKHRILLPCWSVVLTGCLYVCITQGYYKNWLDTPVAQHTLRDARPPEQAAGVAGPEPSHASVRSVRWSNDQLSKLRSACGTNFHLATTIMAMAENKAVMTGVAAITLPLEELHDKAITMCKTRAGVKEWRCSVARGGVDHVLDMVAALSDFDMLLQAGLVSYEEGSGSCVLSDDAALRVAASLVDFLRDMIYSEVVFVRNYAEDLPNCFVSLVDADETQRKKMASRIWRVFEVVTKVESLGTKDMWTRDFCRNLIWPCCTWPREVCIAIGECDGQGLPTDIEQEVLEYAISHGTTKSNEDLFNHLRRAVRSSPSGQMGGAAIWHSSLTSPVMEESDMKPLEPSPEDRLDAKREVVKSQVPRTHFEAKHMKDISVGEEKLARFTESTAWPSMSAERFLLRPFAQHALVNCEDHLGSLKVLWQARLVTPGAILLHRGAGIPAVGRWVLRGTDFGVLTWKVRLRASNGKRFVEPARSLEGEPPWEQILILDFREYSIIDVVALPPTVARRTFVDEPQASITLMLDESKGVEPLARHAARSGFKGLTVAHMDNLVRFAGVDYTPPKPTTERGLAELLVRWQFPENTPQETDAMVSQRGCKPRERHDTILCEENVHVVEGVIAEDDIAEVKSGVKASASKAAAATSARKTSTGAGSEVACSGIASASSAAAQPVEPVVARNGLAGIPEGAYSAIEARSFLPQGCKAWIGVHSNHAWQVKYPNKVSAPKSHTCSWDDDIPGRSHFQCLLLCLRWVWTVHEEHTGEACPWQLPDPSELS